MGVMRNSLRQAIAQEERAIDPLIVRHPRLFHGARPAAANCLPHGWFSLVDQLCSDIGAQLSDDQARRFQVRQIKEKFGTLRFYWAFLHEDPPSDQSRAIEIERLVAQAFEASSSICKTCSLAPIV